MWLPNEVHTKLGVESQFVAAKMREENQPIRKLYFFSAIFNEVSRQLNWYWDQDLALMHLVMQTTHGNLTVRAQQNPPTANMNALMDTLTDTTENLADYVLKNKRDTEILGNILGTIAKLNYASTPHGTYITEKGILKI